MAAVKELFVKICEKGKNDQACEIEVPVGTSLSILVKALEETVLGNYFKLHTCLLIISFIHKYHHAKDFHMLCRHVLPRPQAQRQIVGSRSRSSGGR